MLQISGHLFTASLEFQFLHFKFWDLTYLPGAILTLCFFKTLLQSSVHLMYCSMQFSRLSAAFSFGPQSSFDSSGRRHGLLALATDSVCNSTWTVGLGVEWRPYSCCIQTALSGPAVNLDVVATKAHYLYGLVVRRPLMMSCVTNHSALTLGLANNQLTASVPT